MKSYKPIITVLFALCLPALLMAQTAEDIIAKHIKAHGGAKKWSQVESMKITGKFTAFSLENDFTVFKGKNGCYYANLYLGEKKVIEGFNGKHGWTIDPWQEIEYARRINKAEEHVFMQKAELITPFLNYKEKGHQVEYLGKKDVDGTDTYALKLTRKTGQTETWYLDAKTYLEYKCEANWVDFASGLPAEMYYDDFRKVDGLIIPFFVERIFWQRDRVTQIENIEINAPFQHSKIEMPKRKEILKLAFMEGEWDVKMEFMSRRGTYRERGTTSSVIQFESDNLLQENMSYEHRFPNSLKINFSYNPDNKNYRIAAFNDFTSSIEILQGNLKDNILVIDDTNVSFCNEKNPARTCKQFTYTKLDDNSFTVENKVSNDEGKTWNPQARFTYTRKTDTAISKK